MTHQLRTTSPSGPPAGELIGPRPDVIFTLANMREGWHEVVAGLSNWRIWHLIGSADIRRRYARSRLGQLWLVISTAVSILVLGWVWGALWNAPFDQMILYVGVSFVLWQFLSGILSDGVPLFPSNQHYFVNQYFPPAIVVCAVIYRHMLLLGFNAIIVAVLLLLFGGPPSVRWLLLLPAFATFLIFAYWFVYILAAVSARFRDVGQIVGVVLQIGFFVTPIIWMPSQAPPNLRPFLDFNPLHLIIDVLRSPLIPSPGGSWTWPVMVFLAVAGFIAVLPVIGWLRSRIIFWL